MTHDTNSLTIQCLPTMCAKLLMQSYSFKLKIQSMFKSRAETP